MGCNELISGQAGDVVEEEKEDDDVKKRVQRDDRASGKLDTYTRNIVLSPLSLFALTLVGKGSWQIPFLISESPGASGWAKPRADSVDAVPP